MAARRYKPRSRARRTFHGVVIVPALLAASAAAALGVYLFATVPLPDDIAYGTSTVLDRDGNEVGILSATSRRDIALTELPAYVPQAVMAAEDRSFYEHRGLSLRGTVRALLANVEAGEVAEGGSTITQQYIKNAALTPERTFTRKSKEAVLAVKLEQQHAKDEILSFYLNTIYWGRGAYGIEAAARTYFEVEAAELDVNQALTLAGIIQAPASLDPMENPSRADARRRYVIDGMAQQGWLTPDDARHLAEQGLPPVTERVAADVGPAAYYIDAVRRDLERSLGEDVVYRGLTVHTELDSRMQEAAQRTVSAALGQLPAHLVEKGVSGAVVTVDPEDGGVRAVVGGPGFAEQPFNAAVTGQNQSGSAFKTFGLAAFIDAGNSPDSRFPAPTETTVDFAGSGPYEVSNFGGRGFGEQTVREATLSSTNTVYVQMAADIGPRAVKEMAVRAGIEDDADVEPVPSLVLGTSDVTVLEMARAYATFASGGVRTTPRLVREVEDARGSVIHREAPDQDAAVDADVAYAVSDILADNIQRGTGTRAQIGRPAAGKTGTTQESRDAWFAGYTPQLATAVWVGTLDDTPMGDVTGASIPASIWGDYMREAMEGMEIRDFPDPDLSDLDVLRESPEPSPTPERTTPETVRTTCPGPDGEPVEYELAPGTSCPESTPSPSPSPTEAVEPEPVPEPRPTPDRPAPTPQDSRDGDRGDDGGGSGGEVESSGGDGPTASSRGSSEGRPERGRPAA
jgi:penicillin-binding protein 1A